MTGLRESRDSSCGHGVDAANSAPMPSEAMLRRAVLLFGQHRWDLAIHELRGVLAKDPDHAFAHSLLATALVQKDDLDAAEVEAQAAVGLAPDADFAHRALAVVLYGRERYDDAAGAIRRAIELDPHDADHHAMLAQIRCAQRRWQDALAAADAGLALDPHDVDCLNLRSVALTKLGRGAEATDSLDKALAEDPDDPYTHQARGWALLHRGDAKGALHHFQEALRRNPTLEGARAGLVEALKARNPLYRLVLAWFLWLDGKTQGRQTQILFGAWLAAMVTRRSLAAAGHENAATVVAMSWLGLVLLTACAVPIFNLLLLLHPVGRHALERKARTDALLLGATLAVVLGLSATAWFADLAWADRGWSFWILFLLPVAGLGLFHSGWARRVLQAFCAAVLAGWLWWAVRIHGIAVAVREAAAVPEADRERTAEALLQQARDLGGLHGGLALACALSTWFVLLAPKGRARRR